MVSEINELKPLDGSLKASSRADPFKGQVLSKQTTLNGYCLAYSLSTEKLVRFSYLTYLAPCPWHLG